MINSLLIHVQQDQQPCHRNLIHPNFAKQMPNCEVHGINLEVWWPVHIHDSTASKNRKSLY